MKRIVLATVLAALAAPTFAMAPSHQILSAADEAAIRAVVPGADLSNLTDAQRAALASALYSSENNEVGQNIRSILSTSSVDASRAADFATYVSATNNTTKGSDDR
ncbi:hypothetical protein OU426_17525 [Frigidibacter sp. RF13]|uniref:hypothetical protein n=1 Tax=Frigidibacter sp. RF13 TaxID=2997340 RepID=UPI00226E89B5|nr:hypothetical protein [Frigidibacter sp. RF13]MCY1128661.1 hypothetical protein [Frigidibacter sp. RF13]